MDTGATMPPVRVMVVDDSAVVRGLITRMLSADPRIAVTASCSNGRMAIAQAARRLTDVIILDIEMPVMDGLAALPGLLEASPDTRIIMASTLTQRGAAICLQALAAGATDTIAKPTSDRLGASDEFHRELLEKVVTLGRAAKASHFAKRPPRPIAALGLQLRGGTIHPPRLIAIGSSTGGPQALLTMLGALPPSVDCPIVIAQHMPATFTAVLAQHIARASGRPSVEAREGMEVKPGSICLAPGDFHLRIAREGGRVIAHLSQTPPENFCRPSVDPLFRSVATHFGADGCGVVLTGMGSDGCAGARVMAKAGAPIIAQDEATSVVWGMPGAVAQAGICSAILPLNQIAGHLGGLFGAKAA